MHYNRNVVLKSMGFGGNGQLQYQALYRKWRPMSFAEVVGQEHITRTLINELKTGKMAHAYLFSGPRGTGKTSMARILAKTVNCLNCNEGEPCNECASCVSINQMQEDMSDIIEIDAASNRGIDEIRQLRENVRVVPYAKYKVFIIDEVHMLTTEAFNALLKTLEEPPASVIFVLATTEQHKVPQTVLSRCQRFDFKPLSVNDIMLRLKQISQAEGINAAASGLHRIAELANGGLRDAVAMLEQAWLASGEGFDDAKVNGIFGFMSLEDVYSIVADIADGNSAGVLDSMSRVLDYGLPCQQIIREVNSTLRVIMYCKASEKLAADRFGKRSSEMAAKLTQRLPFEEITSMVMLLAEHESKLRYALDQALITEVALLKCTIRSFESQTKIMASRPLVSGGARAASRQAIAPANDAVSGAVPSAIPTKPSAMDAPDEDKEVGGAIDLGKVRKKWHAFASTLENPLYRSIIKKSEPLSIQGVNLLLRAQNPAAEDTINRAADEVSAAVKTFFGIDLVVCCMVDCQPEMQQPDIKPEKPIEMDETLQRAPAYGVEAEELRQDKPAMIDVLQMFNGTEV